MNTSQIQQNSSFQNAIAAVEVLSLEEQTLLIEIIKKRLQQQKRDLLKQEIESVRQEYKAGKVIFGSVEDFMSQLEEE
jgi:hypothetical protein